MQSMRDNAAAEWFASPLGARVLREETALARLALEDVFGFELLQVGTWGTTPHLLAGARTQHTTLLSSKRAPGVTLCAPLDSLPFASDSIDAIVLPHTLELVEDPYAVLREAERVLCAEGCLMICGFNPYSGWGARRLFGRFFHRPAFPPSDTPHADGTAAPGLDGVARLRGGRRLRISRAHARHPPAA